jgi:hypothetical protein
VGEDRGGEAGFADDWADLSVDPRCGCEEMGCKRGSSAADLEALFTSIWWNIDCAFTLDVAAHGLAEGGQVVPHRFQGALEFEEDGAIRLVLDPAADVAAAGDCLGGEAEADALDTSGKGDLLAEHGE